MAEYRMLPDDASLAEREAHAAFTLLHLALPILRRGQTIADEGWEAFIGIAITTSCGGGGPDAEYLRKALEGMRWNSGGGQ